MDALKKVLHPKQSLRSDDADDTVATQRTESPATATAHTHANAETTAALGSEPNVTGTDRPLPKEDFPTTSSSHAHAHAHDHAHEHDHRQQPRAGHHHPRQPVDATGLPPNHKPREHFTGGVGSAGQAGTAASASAAKPKPPPGVTGADAAVANTDMSGLEGHDGRQELVNLGKVVAETGNNFPGTNPHPTHSALGNQSMTGEKGTLMPGRE